VRKRTSSGEQTPPKAVIEPDTREALDFCFEDVSSLRMLGSTPLADLGRPAMAGGAPAQVPAPSPTAAPPRSGHRWNVVVLALLLLTLAATTAVMLLNR
jgi:hypothetical protein